MSSVGGPSTAPMRTAPSTGPAQPPGARTRPAWPRLQPPSWWRRPEDDPRWVRPAALGLLAATALLYLWGLGASGWANSYYSAAAQAGSVSWKAFLFGSSDAANSITVDKTPLSLWPMALAVRLFGLSSWSVLVPQALEGVAAVGVLYLAVKRWFGASAGLLAGAVMATTPVAVLMFRFNNPDSLLVLELVASVYFLLRALEDGRSRWLLASGAMIGLGFLTKELQAFVLVPVLVGTYLLAGPPRFARRLLQIVWMGVATLLAGGWWVAVVTLWPEGTRPYLGGSQDNTFWNVLFGYNGLGRITGNETGSVVQVGSPTAAGMWGPTGITRMFNPSFGAQASWLIPAALLTLVVGLIGTMRCPRTDRTRAALLIWGGWLVVTGLVFSLSQGIIHEYYTVALAPAIGALVGIGAVEAWRRRGHPAGRILFALGVDLTVTWSFVLLDRTPTWNPWLRWTVLLAGVGLAVVLPFGESLVPRTAPRPVLASLAAVILAVTLAGPVAYSLNTAATPHMGSLPTAGPGGVVFGSAGGPGRGPGGFGAPGAGGALPGPGGPPVGPAGGLTVPSQGPGPGGPDGNPGQGGGSRAGGLLEGSSPGPELTALLDQDASTMTGRRPLLVPIRPPATSWPPVIR